MAINWLKALQLDLLNVINEPILNEKFPQNAHILMYAPLTDVLVQSTRHGTAFQLPGGERGIRTLGTPFGRTPAFQASPFSHSGTSPLTIEDILTFLCP